MIITDKSVDSFAKAIRKNKHMIILYHPNLHHTAYFYASEKDCNLDINNLLAEKKLSNYEYGMSNILHAAMTNIHVVDRYKKAS